jgi:hypothetical protein
MVAVHSPLNKLISNLIFIFTLANHGYCFSGIYCRIKSHEALAWIVQRIPRFDYFQEAALGKRRLQVLRKLMQNFCCYSQNFWEIFCRMKISAASPKKPAISMQSCALYLYMFVFIFLVHKPKGVKYKVLNLLHSYWLFQEFQLKHASLYFEVLNLLVLSCSFVMISKSYYCTR